MQSMPIQLVPEVQIPTLTVTTMWPGATPQEIESEIIQEQEEQLQSVEGVSKMTSECVTTRKGSSRSNSLSARILTLH